MTTSSSPPDPTPIDTGRVRLTSLRMDNIHTHFRWNNDEELNRLDSEEPYEEESFGDFKRRFEQLCRGAPSRQRHFEVHDAEADTLIGVAYVARIRPHHQHARVGLTIGNRDYWGEGYGKEAFRLLLWYCFEELGLHRVTAETFEYNGAWRELVKGMGFTREGRARDYLHRDGTYWDKEWYSLLEEEYREHHAETMAERGPGQPML